MSVYNSSFCNCRRDFFAFCRKHKWFYIGVRISYRIILGRTEFLIRNLGIGTHVRRMRLTKEEQRSHKEKIIDYLNFDRKGLQRYCNKTISSGDETFSVHDCILGASSEYFRTMFSVEMKENHEDVVSIDNVPPKRLENVLEYMYSGDIEVTEENVLEVLEDSEYTQIKDLKLFCNQFILQIVSAENCLKLRAYAQRYSLDDVFDKSNRSIAENFATVVKQRDFMELDVDDMSAILKQRNGKCEEAVTGIIQWVNHNPLQRGDLFVNLFSQINISSIGLEFIAKISTENLVRNNLVCSNMLVDTLVRRTCKDEAVEQINECIKNLIVYPYCFDGTVPSVLKTIKSYALPESTVQKIVDGIYETCIIKPNVRYLGAQLCNTLAHQDTGIPKFRSILLSKAQKEFRGMDNALSGDDTTIERARGFTQFMAELFLSLKMVRPNGKLERFLILGRAIVGAIEKLINHANDENIQCVVRILQLTIMSMEDLFKVDQMGSAQKLQTTLDQLISFLDDDKQSVKLSKATINLLSAFKKLRANNWGRVSKEDAQGRSRTKLYYK